MLPFEDRYTRQRQLPEVGTSGQRKIAATKATAYSDVEREYLSRAGCGEVVLETEQDAELPNSAPPNSAPPDSAPRSDLPSSAYFHNPYAHSFGAGAHRALAHLRSALKLH